MIPVTFARRVLLFVVISIFTLGLGLLALFDGIEMLAVAEHRTVAGPDEGHVELRVAGGIESEVGREVDLRLDDDDVLCSDRLARLAVDLTNAVLEARVAARSGVVAIADFEPRPVRDRNRARVGAARESTRERIGDRRG